MTRLTWNNNVLVFTVIVSVVCQQYVLTYPSNVKDGTPTGPVRNLSDMDEDLVTDADAEFESRKVEHVVSATQHEPVSDSQNFFPSFSSIFSNHPLGHSRPPIFDDPPINNHRARHIPYALQQANSFQGPSGNAYNSYQASQPKSSVAAADNSVLGSGNFGVIRGGTFYEDDYDNNDDYFYPYNSNNGHGRPTNNHYNHQPAHATNNGDFFANFRDFADITAPKSAYSEFHIIYVNKNGTEVNVANDENGNVNTKPRNIFEQLTKLDESESKSKLKKKGINSKAKLALYKEKTNDKLYKKKQNLSSVKEIYHEPLLALS